MLVEAVRGYDGDGRPQEVLFVDGEEVEITAYDLDPDAPMLRRLRDTAGWVAWHERKAAAASPAAAALIRTWARQTAEHGGVLDEQDEEVDWI